MNFTIFSVFLCHYHNNCSMNICHRWSITWSLHRHFSEIFATDRSLNELCRIGMRQNHVHGIWFLNFDNSFDCFDFSLVSYAKNNCNTIRLVRSFCLTFVRCQHLMDIQFCQYLWSCCSFPCSRQLWATIKFCVMPFVLIGHWIDLVASFFFTLVESTFDFKVIFMRFSLDWMYFAIRFYQLHGTIKMKLHTAQLKIHLAPNKTKTERI